MPSMVRSSVAVIVGYMVMMVCVIALTLVMVKTLGRTGGHLFYNGAAACAAAFVGGYAAGAIAGYRRVMHGLILGLVMMVMSVFLYAGYKGAQPGWYKGLMIVLPSAAAVLGAWVCERVLPGRKAV